MKNVQVSMIYQYNRTFYFYPGYGLGDMTEAWPEGVLQAQLPDLIIVLLARDIS